MDADLRAQLLAHEGLRLKPYMDTTGHLTIGIGRNLTDIGISSQEAEILLENDVARVIAGLRANLPWWVGLSEIRKRALIDLAFNVGVGGLLGFRKMLEALRDGRYDDAADELLDSKFATQVQPARVQTLERQIRLGI